MSDDVELLRDMAAIARAQAQVDEVLRDELLRHASTLDRAADALAREEEARGAEGLEVGAECTTPGRARAWLKLGDVEHILVSFCADEAEARRALAARLRRAAQKLESTDA